MNCEIDTFKRRQRDPQHNWKQTWETLIQQHGVNVQGCSLSQQICTNKGPSATLKFRDIVHVARFTDALVAAGFKIYSDGPML